MEQIINILLGAAIASIIPTITLILNQRRWKAEKRIEVLRVKHDRLERIYAEILERMGPALAEGTWPSDVTSKIMVYGSNTVKNTLKEFVMDKEKDDQKRKSFYYELSEACNIHLLEIQTEIEQSI